MRRLVRLVGLMSVVLVLLGVFTLYAAPEFMLPERMRVLARALPSLAPREPVAVLPPAQATPAAPTVNRMTHTPRTAPTADADASAAAPAPATEAPATQRTLPVAERKTIRIGD